MKSAKPKKRDSSWVGEFIDDAPHFFSEDGKIWRVFPVPPAARHRYAQDIMYAIHIYQLSLQEIKLWPSTSDLKTQLRSMESNLNRITNSFKVNWDYDTGISRSLLLNLSSEFGDKINSRTTGLPDTKLFSDLFFGEVDKHDFGENFILETLRRIDYLKDCVSSYNKRVVQHEVSSNAGSEHTSLRTITSLARSRFFDAYIRGHIEFPNYVNKPSAYISSASAKKPSVLTGNLVPYFEIIEDIIAGNDGRRVSANLHEHWKIYKKSNNINT